MRILVVFAAVVVIGLTVYLLGAPGPSVTPDPPDTGVTRPGVPAPRPDIPPVVPEEPAPGPAIPAPPPPECDRPSPRLVEALNTKKVTMKFDRTPIETAVEYLERCLGETIRAPLRIYEERTREECEVTLDLKDVTVRTALDRITKAVGQVWWIEEGEIRIGGWLPASMYFLRHHDLADLLGAGRDGDAIADQVCDEIDRHVWNQGGEVFFDEKKAALTVEAPPNTHAKVQRLLKKLREEKK